MSTRTNGRTTATRILNKILASEWAIRPEWLGQFAGIANRLGPDGAGTLTAEAVRSEIRTALAELDDGGFSSIAFGYGEPLAEDSHVTVRNGVATIPITGPLFHYATAFDDVCGCSSYARIAQDIAAVRAAHREGVVRAVLLEVDSPGGEIGGVAETADMIAELAEEMTVAAFVTDLGASAAYWLSAAAAHVVSAPTSLIGSIGVVATFRKDRDQNTIEIVSSQSPKKRPDLETDAGRAQVQETLDALAEVFLEAVAGYRGVNLNDARTQFGEGDVLVGQLAVDAGLADEVGSFEALLAELASGTRFVPRRGTRTPTRRMS